MSATEQKSTRTVTPLAPASNLTAKTTNKNRNKSRRKYPAKGRRRGPKPYVVVTLDEAMTLGRGIIEHGAGHPMKRVTLLEKLKLSDNVATRNLITHSGKYGITQGGYQADEIRLTPTGAL